MNRIIFFILCALMLFSFSSCTSAENKKEFRTLSEQSTESRTLKLVDIKKSVEDFMLAIDSNDIAGIYASDYGMKWDYVYDKETLKEFQEGYPSISEQMDKIIKKISYASEDSMLANFKSDLKDLLKQKNELLKQQKIAIEKGGKWKVEFKHGSDVDLIMAIEHYGNNVELIKKIKDYNLSAKAFIKKYELDRQKYEFGDEKAIFIIY